MEILLQSLNNIFWSFLKWFRKTLDLIFHCIRALDNWFNQFQLSVAFHIQTSHLNCIVNQITGFYMKFNINRKRVVLRIFSLYFKSNSFCNCNISSFPHLRFSGKTKSAFLILRSFFKKEKKWNSLHLRLNTH